MLLLPGVLHAPITSGKPASPEDRQACQDSGENSVGQQPAGKDELLIAPQDATTSPASSAVRKDHEVWLERQYYSRILRFDQHGGVTLARSELTPSGTGGRLWRGAQ
jgi:hypothetical protein